MGLRQKLSNLFAHKHLKKTKDILKKVRTPVPVHKKKGEKAVLYFVEILSECDLKCALCAFGHRDIFQRRRGKMSLEHFEKILDKIKKDSPSATVSPYCQCEPSLHPDFLKVLKAIKDRGFRCAISSNFNNIKNLKEVVETGVDSIEISVSGFTQEMYEKSHIGGEIEKVKNNMKLLREILDVLPSSFTPPHVYVVYHMYKDNLQEEYDNMKSFTENLGFDFAPCWSRAINMELSLKYLREKGLSKYEGETLEWFDDLKPLDELYHKTMDRMVYLPQDFMEGKWKDVEITNCCCDNAIVIISWDGQIKLCGYGFDDRSAMGDFLTTPLEEIYEKRKKHPLCKECLKNKYTLYCSYADMDEIDKIAHSRLPEDVALDRKFGG